MRTPIILPLVTFTPTTDPTFEINSQNINGSVCFGFFDWFDEDGMWNKIGSSGTTTGPRFEINSRDRFVLKDKTEQEVFSVGIGENGRFDWSWALVVDRWGNHTMVQTTTPTPEAENIITRPEPRKHPLRPLHPLILNEVSDMGTEATCEGKDWIELFNQGAEVLALDGL